MKLTKTKKVDIEQPISCVAELLEHLHDMHTKITDVMEAAGDITGLIEDCQDHVTDEQYDFLYENFDDLHHAINVETEQGELWEAIEKLEQATKPKG
jgi:hypothetical protein